jgi:hypothetical protein
MNRITQDPASTANLRFKPSDRKLVIHHIGGSHPDHFEIICPSCMPPLEIVPPATRIHLGSFTKVHLEKKLFVVDSVELWGWCGQCDQCGQAYLFTDERFANVSVKVPINGEV